MRQRIIATPGAKVHEIGGTENHVHLAVAVPPTLTISDWIGKLKGGTSHDVNERLRQRQKVLQWQAGYGVVSLGTQNVAWVRRYIQNQRQHHALGTTAIRLERVRELDHDA